MDDTELFSLKGLSTVEDVGRVQDAQIPDADMLQMIDNDSDDIVSDNLDDTEDEEDRRRFELLQEDYLEESYNRYRRGKVSPSSFLF